MQHPDIGFNSFCPFSFQSLIHVPWAYARSHFKHGPEEMTIKWHRVLLKMITITCIQNKPLQSLGQNFRSHNETVTKLQYMLEIMFVPNDVHFYTQNKVSNNFLTLFHRDALHAVSDSLLFLKRISHIMSFRNPKMKVEGAITAL